MVTCTKCHKEFEENDSIMVCTRCGAMYHKDCWFSEPVCMKTGCLNDRGFPLRGENIDPEMQEDFSEELLEESKTKKYLIQKYIPMIIAVVLFLTWIALNSYNDYQKHHRQSNTITFTEKK